MRRISMWLSLLALGLAACAPGGQREQPGPVQEAAGRQQYTVLVDAPSPLGQNIQVAAYFPAVVQAHPGDTLTFENQSSQVPHTVTFGVAADRSDAPAPVTKDGKLNPVAFGPCFMDQPPARDLSECPQQPGGQPPSFDGRGLWSVFLTPDLPQAPAQAKVAQLELAQGIAPGQYDYVCLLHPFMGGVVQVVDRETKTRSPAEVAQAAKEGQTQTVTQAAALQEPPEPGGGTAVNAGWGDQVVEVNRFAPATVTVSAGTTVTWRTRGAYEPHTITFESPFSGPDDPTVVMPRGVPPGGHTATVSPTLA